MPRIFSHCYLQFLLWEKQWDHHYFFLLISACEYCDTQRVSDLSKVSWLNSALGVGIQIQDTLIPKLKLFPTVQSLLFSPFSTTPISSKDYLWKQNWLEWKEGWQKRFILEVQNRLNSEVWDLPLKGWHKWMEKNNSPRVEKTEPRLPFLRCLRKMDFDDRNRTISRSLGMSVLRTWKRKPQKVLKRVSSSFTSALPSFFFFNPIK